MEDGNRDTRKNDFVVHMLLSLEYQLDAFGTGLYSCGAYF